MHRTKAFWDIQKSFCEEYKQKIAQCERKVTIKISVLKEGVRVKPSDWSIVKCIIQQYSVEVMRTRQKTVAHSLHDCYNLFQDNSTSNQFKSILICEYNEKNITKNWLLHATQNTDLKETPWTQPLQRYFSLFFYNEAFGNCSDASSKVQSHRRIKGKPTDFLNEIKEMFDWVRSFSF